METITDLKLNAKYKTHKKIFQKFSNLECLVAEVRKKELKTKVITYINQQISEFNACAESEKEYLKQIRKLQYNIIKILEKEQHIIPKGYYRNKWFALGMTTFGISFGVVFSVLLDNYAFIGIGLPIGMSIGMAIGAGKDNQAKKEGRQLDIDLKW